MSTETADTSQSTNPGTTATETQGQESQAAASTETTATEGQTQGESTAEATAETAQATGAPEEYAAFNLPEGFELAGDRLTEANELFKGLNLTQEQAQTLVDRYAGLMGKDSAGIAEAVRNQAEADRIKQIEDDGKAAKDTLGADYDATTKLAQRAVEMVGDPELVALFNERGWGNNLTLIRAFAKFGKALSNGETETGGSTANRQTQVPIEDRMYGTKS